MKVFEYCMFHNEHAALEIKLQEALHWVDELHLCEADRTFKGAQRRCSLPSEDSFLRTHMFDGTARFHKPVAWGPSRHFPFFRRRSMARRNESLQRNFVHEALAHVGDKDIVVLSDIDEIIDVRYADELIAAARKHEIISIELRHTLYYLNLYSTNWHTVWPGSPQNYAYRVFVMTGAYFHKMRRSGDRLRRLGEWGRLKNEIHLLQGYRGFHHSWLGDEAGVLEKMRSYAHDPREHDPELVDEQGEILADRLAVFVREGRSLFPGNHLEIHDFDQIEPLRSARDIAARVDGLLL